MADGKKKSFGFRSTEDNIKRWIAYTNAKAGAIKDDIYTAALNEYMNNHPLEGTESQAYDSMLEAAGIDDIYEFTKERQEDFLIYGD